MIRSRDAAFIRKLCGLGLPSQVLVQTLLPALRRLIPAHSAGVFWVDAKGEMTRLYAERMLPPEAMARYYERHYAASRDGFTEAFRQRAACPDPVSVKSFTRTEQDREYFRDVLHPLDAYHVLYGVLVKDGRAIAQISLYRGQRDSAFGDGDSGTLRSLLRYLAQGLGLEAGTTSIAGPTTVADEQVGIVAADGRVLAASAGWAHVIRLAASEALSPRDARREGEASQTFIRSVISEVAARNSPEERKGGAYDTVWGRFTVRAFAMESALASESGQIALIVRREEPTLLAMVRGSGFAEMSPQQREVALLLAQGLSNREIAEQLGLSLNTASYHVKQVFARMRVNDRNEVARELLHLAQSSTCA